MMTTFANLDTPEKRASFKFYLLHGLVRHLKDCIKIAEDLKKLDDAPPDLLHLSMPDDMRREFGDWLIFLTDTVPDVDKWIEVKR